MKIQQRNLKYQLRYHFGVLLVTCVDRSNQFSDFNNGYLDRVNGIDFYKDNHGDILLVGFPRLLIPYEENLEKTRIVDSCCRSYIPQILQALNLVNALPVNTSPIISFPTPDMVMLENRWVGNE